MKKYLWLILLVCPPIFADSKVVNIYSWSNYIPNKVINQFEKTTGITVHLSEFDSNATLYAKLKADPKSGYDVIIPSSFYLQRMIRQHMVQPLDKNKLPNRKYLNPLLLNKKFDRHNQYSLPYLWGTTGILVNSQYWNPKTITRWQDFWQSRFKNQILLMDSARETFSIAMLSLGYSMNDKNPKHIKQAFEKLKKLMRNVKLFNSDAVISTYTDSDATIGMAWSGDAMLATAGNPHLHYIYPKDGFAVWEDVIAIPANAPNLNNAYRFINFLMLPKIAAEISKAEGYSTPNLEALKLLPKKWRKSPIFNPSPAILKRGHFQLDLGKANLIYQKYWELLKLGDRN